MSKEDKKNEKPEQDNNLDSVLYELESEANSEEKKCSDTVKQEDDWKDKYFRLLAEFDNYKKHVSQQMFELKKYEGEIIFREIIEILDDLEKALSYSDSEEIKRHPVLQGVELTFKNLRRFLNKFGVDLRSVLNEKFDPSTMEAIQKIEVEKEKEGLVLQEFKKLCTFKDKILRYAEVAVGVTADIKDSNHLDS